MSDANQGAPKAYVINCPACGGTLRLETMREVVYCPSCGNAIYLSLPTDGRAAEADGTVRDASTGYGLFRMKVPSGWQVTGTALRRTQTSSRPYVAQVELRDRSAGTITLRMGEAGTRKSAGMNALLGAYGGHLAGIDTSNYADVPDPIAVADSNASMVASGVGATQLRFSRQLAFGNLEGERNKILHAMRRQPQSMGIRSSNPLVGIVLRIYELTVNGRQWQLASFVRLEAIKQDFGMDEGVSNALGGLADSLGDMASRAFGGMGSLFSGQQGGQGQAAGQSYDGQQQGLGSFIMGGGLLGKKLRERQAAMTTQQPVPTYQQPTAQAQPTQMAGQAQQAPSQGSAWCIPEFSQYVSSGTIKWGIPLVATYLAPAESFDAQLRTAFLPLVSTIAIHPDVESLTVQAIQQESAQIQAATQGQIARNQQAFQMQQAAHQQQQAAFDSYNSAWQARSDAQHQQFRAATNAQFATPAGGAAPDFSEAIRGVNTYTTSDGREVEVTVRADRAYENQAGDVIGTSGGFEPGADWTEIPRA